MIDQHLITEPIIDAARVYLSQNAHPHGIRTVRSTEPHLYYAVTSLASGGFGGLEGMPTEAHDAMYRTVWEAVLFSLEAYRVAHYRLWRDTEMGAMLSKLDPVLARREARRAGRRRGEGGPESQAGTT